MKNIVIFMVVLCVVSNAFSCKVTYKVTPDTIDDLPLLVFVSGNKYVVHVRDTGNLEGLLATYLVINGEEKDAIFYRDLPEWGDDETDTYTVTFNIPENTITEASSIRIYLIDPFIKHSTECEYRIPLALIQNKFTQLNNVDRQSLLERFTKKEFKYNREESPNHDLQPTPLDAGDEGSAQGGAAEI